MAKAIWLPPYASMIATNVSRLIIGLIQSVNSRVSQYLELYITDPQTNWPIDNLQSRPTHWLVFRMMKEVEDLVMINETPLPFTPSTFTSGNRCDCWENARSMGEIAEKREPPYTPPGTPPFLTWPSCWEKQVQIQESGTRGNLPATDAGHPRRIQFLTADRSGDPRMPFSPSNPSFHVWSFPCQIHCRYDFGPSFPCQIQIPVWVWHLLHRHCDLWSSFNHIRSIVFVTLHFLLIIFR